MRRVGVDDQLVVDPCILQVTGDLVAVLAGDKLILVADKEQQRCAELGDPGGEGQGRFRLAQWDVGTGEPARIAHNQCSERHLGGNVVRDVATHAESEHSGTVTATGFLGATPAFKFAHLKHLAYNSSQAALNALTIQLAYDLRDTLIKINAVDPGYTATAFNAGQAHARRWTNRQSGYSAVRDTTTAVLIVAEGLHDSASADIENLTAAIADELNLIWLATPRTTRLSRSSPRFEF